MTTEPSPSGGTASNMAAFRALETCKPESVRLFADPYAVRFLPLWQRWLVMAARIPGLRPVIERYAHGLVPGAGTSAVARTRLIDDWLREEIRAGARQVVILGAGFDCRALRLLELESIDVFELDRVAMVAFKNRKLEDVARNNVRRIAVDFLRDSLVDRLAAAGFARGKRTAFVWEGVTNYLDRRSIAAVFDFVTSASPAGSKIAFTYVHADAIEGRFEARGLAPLLESLKKRGEAWTFGFRPEELGAYLERHGLRLLRDLGADEYRSLFWPSLPKGTGYEFYHAALAEVAGSAAR
jgi:methyltransferase (TIGR00027 family)